MTNGIGVKTGRSRKTHTVYRDSKTGRFISEKDAKRRPATTQKERIPAPGRGDTGRGTRK